MIEGERGMHSLETSHGMLKKIDKCLSMVQRQCKNTNKDGISQGELEDVCTIKVVTTKLKNDWSR